jgi:hypothetical protein
MTALRAFVSIGLAAFWLLLVAPPMFQTPQSVYTGTHIVLTGAPVQPNIIRVDPGSPAYRAGLRTGDVLGCLSPRDAALLIPIGAPNAYRAGMPISTCVQRNGVLHRVSFVAQTGPRIENTYGSDALAALRLLFFIVFFLTGIALVMSRPSLMTWIFYAYCLGSAPSFAAGTNWTVLPAWEYAIASGIPGLGSGTAVAFLLLFAVLVPNDRVASGWRRNAFLIACAVAFADVLLVAANVFYTGVVLGPSFSNGVDEALTIVTVLVVLTRLATMERDERARFGWAAFAIIFGVVANDLRNVLSVGPFSSLSVVAADLTVVMPLCLMYAILKRHVIDVRFVISRTVVYAALTTVVVLVIGIVDWVTSAYLTQVRVAMAIDAAVTVGVAFTLHRAYRWVENVVDSLLFRRKHQAQAYLNRLGRTLLRAEREDTIDRALVHAPYERLEIQVAALFRAQGRAFVMSEVAGSNVIGDSLFDTEHELVRFLATERRKVDIRDLRTHFVEQPEADGGPAVAIPIFQGDELTAFAVYGIHRDGTKLDPDEIETLEQLCETAAQAYVRIELLRYRTDASAPALA